jgi:uncharacterized protein (TIGR03086 family)
MDELLEQHRRALEEFGRRAHAVRADQWQWPTPDEQWNVRDLVNHLVVEQLWVPPLLAGQTVAEVGDRLDGDQLGDDPVASWDQAARAAAAKFAEPGALGRTVHLSFGDSPAADYCREAICDLVVHSWDLARAINADDRLDPSLVRLVYEYLEPRADAWRAAGAFGARVEVPADADPQARLLGATGRRP